LKQYYRGLLAIPTGDKDDPDHGTVQEEPASKPQNNPPKKPQEPPAEAIERAQEYLSEADSLDDLKARWGRIPADIKTFATVIAAKDAAKDKLIGSPIDLGGDSIPY
jgi:hypothetical protein